VLDEAEQCRVRGQQATTCLLLRQLVQRVVPDDAVLVDERIHTLAIVGSPVTSIAHRHHVTLGTPLWRRASVSP
jgi:hypothetical protein